MTLPLPPVVSSQFAGASVQYDVPLAALTTLRVGPVARRLITCDTTEKLIAVLRELPAGVPAEKTLVLAGGSNVVITDDLTDLTAVQVANTEITVEGAVCGAEAGALWDDVVVTSLAYGSAAWSACPASPDRPVRHRYRNVGAYGAEVADTVSRVRLLDRRTGADRWVSPSALGFGYRHSVLRNSKDSVVLEVEFTLDAEGEARRCATGADDGAGRRTRLPGRPHPGSGGGPDVAQAQGHGARPEDHDTWSVGSFFTKPVVTPDVFERLRSEVDGPVPNYPAPNG